MASKDPPARYPPLHDTILVDQVRVYYCVRVDTDVVIDWIDIENFPRTRPPEHGFASLDGARAAVERWVRLQLTEAVLCAPGGGPTVDLRGNYGWNEVP